jgi:peptidoglycan/LPS O-acetylase OafA/YrhL
MQKFDEKRGHALIMWIIWFAVLQGAFVFQWVLGKGFPQGENAAEPMAAALWLLCFGPILLATLVRWLVIPKMKQAQPQLVAMIIGLSLAEAPIFFSLFLVGPEYPQNQIAVLMVAVVAIIQFAPSYATPGYDAGRKVRR